MFTNEFNEFSTVTTILDEESNFEDVIVEITDDMVTIRQYNDSAFDDIPDYVTMSAKMFKDILHALKQPEGMYQVEYQTDSLLET